MFKIAATLLLSSLFVFSVAQNQKLLKLKYHENYTPTYAEVVDMYKLLDANYENARLIEVGNTDSGKPLHTFIINNEIEFNPEKIKQKGKSVLLINNGIHAGEPCGIDASLEFADDILRNKNGMTKLLENTVIVIIPVYSIGGVLNRSAYNRSGQTTPYETGFRGNAANYDLNRDFIKCDSENAKTFTSVFHKWDPDVFLDTHTTNGSDHQYSVTLIAPQPDVFPPIQEEFLRKKMLPDLFRNMKEKEYELIPYVSWMYPDPKKGIKMTQESARYSSGYASLFNCYGMMTENHIYKPYTDRVKSCYQFIEVLAGFTSANSREIIESREKGLRETFSTNKYAVDYELDTTVYKMIEFKGYEVDENQISPLTGLKRFGYDRNKSYTANIKYFDEYRPTIEIKVPEFYVLPQAYKVVIQRLILNKVEFQTILNDTIIEVELDYIEEYSNASRPYNGHYFHDKISTRSEIRKLKYYAGDLLIPVRQSKMNYILEVLEPKAKDSFLKWNFFDNILDAREYFSGYGFEENALKYLNEHPEFKKEFEEKQKNDAEFAKNHRAQMAYIYNNSEWREESYKRYPVGKIF